MHDGEDVIFDLQKTKKGCYRAKVTDTDKMSTNVFVVGDLAKVEEELENKITVINITKSTIFKKCVVLINEYVHIGPGLSSIGHTVLVGSSFLRKLRPGKGSTTPSNMKMSKWQ